MRRQPRGPMWKNRIVAQGEERPDQLLANPQNWRLHPEAQQDEVEKLLETVGWVQRVLVNRRTGHVVDGHLRIQLALRRDEETVPVTYIDVSHDEERLLLAALDPLSAMAGRDQEQLDGLVHDIAVAMPDLDVDLEAILAKDRAHAKGLHHEVKRCICCEAKCKPGCGCYDESTPPRTRKKR